MTSASIRPVLLHCAETVKGGIATYLRELIPLQCRTFGEANVILLIPESQQSDLPVPRNVRVECYKEGSNRILNAIHLGWVALRTARRYQVSIVHIHSTFAGLTVRPILRLGYRLARLVYCPHGWAWDRPMSSLARKGVRFTERILSSITNRIVCISEHEFVGARATGMQANKLRVVRNAISTQRPDGIERQSFGWPNGASRRVLFVGRFDRQKGVDVLFSAMEILGEEAHAIIAGDAVLDDGKKGPLPTNITRIGWLAPGEIEALFDTAHVLVVPSRWEGFGLVALEAMRAGLPVIASRVGGLAEIVEDGVTGYLIPPESPTELAKAIRQLDDSNLKKMGQAGRQRMRDLFGIERLHDELMKLYFD